MRIAAFVATILIACAACSTTSSAPTGDTYQQPNSLMAGEITLRVEQIPYQHREELLQNLMWLAQTGEQTIPVLLTGLKHENPKVRSSCSWVLGRLRDRRTIPNLQAAMQDSDPTVRLECARTLVLLGDIAHSPALIEGLDSERKEVRYLCHEALKTATGHDFGYDHLTVDKNKMQLSVLRWRQWWSEYSGDLFFAQNYQKQHGIIVTPAAPVGETQTQVDGQPMPVVPNGQTTPDGQTVPNSTPEGSQGEVLLDPLPNTSAPTPNGNQGVVAPTQTPATPTPGPLPRPNGSK